jgi:hypothetical protein
MANQYKPNSRYTPTAMLIYHAPDGREIAYGARRLLPRPEQFKPLAIYRHDRDRRIDDIANAYYGDPEQYWRICDANLVFWPPDATAIADARLVIPLPLEISGHDQS